MLRTSEATTCGPAWRRTCAAVRCASGPPSRLAGALVLALLVWPSAAQAAPCGLVGGNHVRTLVQGELERSYDVRVPAGCDTDTPLALVFDFHDLDVPRAEHATLSGFRALADARSAVVVVPQGYAEPKGSGVGWNAFEGQFGTSRRDDLGFVRDLVESLEGLLPIDRARVYATGHGHGGAFAHRLGCQAGDLVTAIALVAYSAYGSGSVRCPATDQPVGFLQFHGLDDLVVPYDGQILPFFGILSAPDSALLWQARNGCEGATERVLDAGEASCDATGGCLGDVRVELCTLTDDHDLYDNPNDIDIAARSFDFFAQHVPEPAGFAGQAAALIALVALRRATGWPSRAGPPGARATCGRSVRAGRARGTA